MTRPITSEMERIATSAIFELSVCRSALQQIESVISVIRPGLQKASDAYRVLEMAQIFIESISSNAEACEEALEVRFEKAAPQNADTQIRGAEAEVGQ